MKAIVIGSSTGGPYALRSVLEKLPESLHAYVFILQHISEGVAKSLQKTLASHSSLPLKEIKNDERLMPSQVYVVPGGMHFLITSPGPKASLIEAKARPIPSIDTGFTSIGEHFGPETVGVVLTGMGSDGVIGAKAIKQVGGYIIAQNEESSDVYGMPRAVKEAGFADEVLDLDQIADRLRELCL